jgi:hypothetical protein
LKTGFAFSTFIRPTDMDEHGYAWDHSVLVENACEMWTEETEQSVG